jgi:methylaspartate mutase sigma subunit
LFVGGNIVVGKQDWEEVHQKFKDMGFDRVYPPGTSTETAVKDLKEALEVEA